MQLFEFLISVGSPVMKYNGKNMCAAVIEPEFIINVYDLLAL